MNFKIRQSGLKSGLWGSSALVIGFLIFWLIGQLPVGAQTSPTLTSNVFQTETRSVRGEVKTSDNALYRTTATEWRWAWADNPTVCIQRQSTIFNNPVQSRTNSTGYDTLALSDSNDGQTACLRASSGNQDLYSSVEIDLSPPTITTITQDGETIVVTVSDASIKRTTASPFPPVTSRLEYKPNVTSATTECQARSSGFVSGSNVTASTTQPSATSSAKFDVQNHASNNGSTICFRFADAYDNRVIKTYVYSNTGPQISSSRQNGTGAQTEIAVTSRTAALWAKTTIDTGSTALTATPCSTPNTDDFTTAPSRSYRAQSIDNSDQEKVVCIFAKDQTTGNISKALYILDGGWSATGFSEHIFQNNLFVSVLIPQKDTVDYSVVDSQKIEIFDMAALAINSRRYILIDHVATNNRVAASNCNATANTSLYHRDYSSSTHSGSTVRTPRSFSGQNGFSVVQDSSFTTEAVCIAVSDTYGNAIYGYKSIAIADRNQPYIEWTSRTAYGNSIDLSLRGTNQPDLDWYRGSAISGLDQLTSASCAATTDATSQFARNSQTPKLTIQTADVDKYICVRVQITDSSLRKSDYYSWIYTGKSPIDSSRPRVTISKSNLEFTAVATDSGGSGLRTSSWRYAVMTAADMGGQATQPAANDKCAEQPSPATPALVWQNGSSVTLTGSSATRYICFNVTDNAGNHGFRNHIVGATSTDQTNPSLSVRQNQENKVAYTATDDVGINQTSHAYIGPLTARPSSCSSSSGTWPNPANGKKTTVFAATDVGKYYCFRVADTSGNYGYSNVLTVIAVTVPDPDDDATGPVITVSQRGSRVIAIASGRGNTDWAFYKADSDEDPATDDQPACDGSDTTAWAAATSGKIVTVTAADVGLWICFRVKNLSNVYGYKKHQVASLDDTATAPGTTEPDTTAPGSTNPGAGTSGNVSFTPQADNPNQINVGLVTGTAESYRWLYYGNESLAQRRCKAGDEVDTRTDVGTSAVINMASFNESRWYCYSIADSAGTKHYGIYAATKTGAGAVAPGTTQPPATTTPSTPDPGTTSPVTPDPGTTEPATPDPGTTSPVTPDPGTTEPVTPDPGTGSVTPGSGSTDPGVGYPGGDPGSVQTPDPSGTGDPGSGSGTGDGQTDPADPNDPNKDGEKGFFGQYMVLIIIALFLSLITVVLLAVLARNKRNV